MKFDKKAICNTENSKNKPIKIANFNQNKPKNKQPASLQKNPQIDKKVPCKRRTSVISRAWLRRFDDVYGSSLLKKKNSTLLGQFRESTGL